MIEEFIAFVEQQQLFTQHDQLLLAVSGGADSVVLADLCHRAGYPFAIAHCNFQLRGQDSLDDEAFVRDLAKQYGVACLVKAFATEEVAAQAGESVQMVARHLRYQWFAKLLSTKKYRYVVTAHHKNDVLETLLFNLAKGTGIAGLRGMPAKNDALVRPLLFAEKHQITDYIAQYGLRWREDSSNASVKYARNLIRHQVVPALQQINPALLQTLSNTLERLQGTEAILQHYVQEVRERSVTRRGAGWWLSIEVLGQTTAPPLVLAEILKPFGFSYEQAREVTQNLSAPQPGKIFLAPGYQLNVDRTHLIISPAESSTSAVYRVERSTQQVDIAGKFTLQIACLPAQHYQIQSHPAVAALDANKLMFPLSIRRWQPGDWFCPLGMQQKKKLSDFLIDRKVPLNLKNQVYVLCSGPDIAWVIGHQIDNRYKLTAATREILEIRQQE